MKKKIRTITAYADISSHGWIFMFDADAYPTLLHIFKKKVTPDLRKVKITYEV